jgi:hypothetical protein
MPGRGNAGHGHGDISESAGVDPHGRSDSSPGHQKREAGTASASGFAPGHGGTPPGQLDRNAGEAAVERPEPDSLEREN